MDRFTTVKNPDDWGPDFDEAHERIRRKLPEDLRRVYDGGEIGKDLVQFHTKVEFEYPTENALGARSYISLGTLSVYDPEGRIGFRRGERIEVNGVEATVTEIDVAKERDENNRLITFWSVVLGV